MIIIIRDKFGHISFEVGRKLQALERKENNLKLKNK